MLNTEMHEEERSLLDIYSNLSAVISIGKTSAGFSGVVIQEDVDLLEIAQRGALSVTGGLRYDQGGKR